MTVKRTLWLIAMTLLSLTAHAQHFDWVKTYTGSDPSGYLSNYIISSVCDANGDLYILGHFSNDAAMDGDDMLPINPSRPDNLNVCIAKVSARGELIWRKIIHSKKYNCTSYDMQIIGDSLLVCLVSIVLPTADDDNIWYLDTLLTRKQIDYLMPVDSIGSPSVCGIITLNLDGGLVEHHFLQTAYIDSHGEIITYDKAGGMLSDSNRYAVRDFRAGPFCMDGSGNFYLAHVAEDVMWVMCDTCQDGGGFSPYSIENGLLSGIVILVDGRPRFRLSPQGSTSHRNYRLFKFSQHFDTLLNWQYVFDLSENIQFEYDEGASLAVDNEGGLYFSKCIRNPTQVLDYLIKDGNGLSIRTSEEYSSFIIKYSNEMIPIYVVQPTSNESPVILNNLTNFHTLKIDEDSNSLFILATILKFEQNTQISINNNILDIDKNASFIRIDKNSGEIISYGKAPSSDLTSFLMKKTMPGLVVKNNRVFSQLVYRNNLECNGSTLNIPAGQIGKCLYIWDYRGNALTCIDYGSTSQQSEGGTALSLFDSVLYLSGYTTVDITFGDSTIYTSGSSMAYIACYIDTAFMTSYIHTEDPGEVSITLVEDGLALVAYPNPFRQRVNVEYSGQQPITAAYLTDIMGRTEQVELSATAPGRYTLDLTSRPQVAYLLTLVTQDGHRHTVRLLKQSEVFGK